MPRNNPLSNPSRALFGYHFDYKLLEEDQRRLTLDYALTPHERSEVMAHLQDTFLSMVETAREMFRTNTACTHCGERALVSDSRHEFFSGATEDCYNELVDEMFDINENLIDVTSEYIYGLKPLFEALEESYLAEKISSRCATEARLAKVARRSRRRH